MVTSKLKHFGVLTSLAEMIILEHDCIGCFCFLFGFKFMNFWWRYVVALGASCKNDCYFPVGCEAILHVSSSNMIPRWSYFCCKNILRVISVQLLFFILSIFWNCSSIMAGVIISLSWLASKVAHDQVDSVWIGDLVSFFMFIGHSSREFPLQRHFTLQGRQSWYWNSLTDKKRGQWAIIRNQELGVRRGSPVSSAWTHLFHQVKIRMVCDQFRLIFWLKAEHSVKMKRNWRSGFDSILFFTWGTKKAFWFTTNRVVVPKCVC